MKLIKIRQTLEMIKFSHSIFALPFALSSLFLASNGHPSVKIILLVILAMVFARSSAMGFNRWLDADLDAKNPRTATRHIPAGILDKKFVIFFVMANSLLFVTVTYFINHLTFVLSPLALFIIFLYSTTKRWTHFTQIFLGLSLGIAPPAAWIAFTGTVSIVPLLMGLAVLCWVSGFDLIYAIQDYEFDKQNNVKSMVALLGIPKSLYTARFLHFLALVFFGIMGFLGALEVSYFITLGLMGCLLIIEHRLVTPRDLSKINAAFFNVNGMIGILYFLGCLVDLYF